MVGNVYYREYEGICQGLFIDRRINKKSSDPVIPQDSRSPRPLRRF